MKNEQKDYLCQKLAWIALGSIVVILMTACSSRQRVDYTKPGVYEITHERLLLGTFDKN